MNVEHHPPTTITFFIDPRNSRISIISSGSKKQASAKQRCQPRPPQQIQITHQVGGGGGDGENPLPFNAFDLAQSSLACEASPFSGPLEGRDPSAPATPRCDTSLQQYPPAGGVDGGGGRGEGMGNVKWPNPSLGGSFRADVDADLDLDLDLGMDLGMDMGMDMGMGAQLVVPGGGGGGGAWMWRDRHPGVLIPPGWHCC